MTNMEHEKKGEGGGEEGSWGQLKIETERAKERVSERKAKKKKKEKKKCE